MHSSPCCDLCEECKWSTANSFLLLHIRWPYTWYSFCVCSAKKCYSLHSFALSSHSISRVLLWWLQWAIQKFLEFDLPQGRFQHWCIMGLFCHQPRQVSLWWYRWNSQTKTSKSKLDASNTWSAAHSSISLPILHTFYWWHKFFFLFQRKSLFLFEPHFHGVS